MYFNKLLKTCANCDAPLSLTSTSFPLKYSIYVCLLPIGISFILFIQIELNGLIDILCGNHWSGDHPHANLFRKLSLCNANQMHTLKYYCLIWLLQMLWAQIRFQHLNHLCFYNVLKKRLDLRFLCESTKIP